MIFPGNIILQALPIFYFGYLFPEIEKHIRTSAIQKKVIILIPLLFLLFDPSFVQDRFQGQFSFLFCNFLAGLIIVWSILAANSKQNFFTNFSQRSYSLYAVHAPLLLIIDKVFFSKSEVSSSLQTLISLLVIFFATELVYRYIEKPSINFSRKYLTTRS